MSGDGARAWIEGDLSLPRSVLEEIHATDSPRVLVLNKADAIDEVADLLLERHQRGGVGIFQPVVQAREVPVAVHPQRRAKQTENR